MNPEALEAAARVLYERVRVHEQIPWEDTPFQDEVREWAKETVQAYLDALPKP